MKKIFILLTCFLMTFSFFSSAYADGKSESFEDVFKNCVSFLEESFPGEISTELDEEIPNSIFVSCWYNGKAFADAFNVRSQWTDEVLNAYNDQKAAMQFFSYTLFSNVTESIPDSHVTLVWKRNADDPEMFLAFFDGKCVYDLANDIDSYEKARNSCIKDMTSDTEISTDDEITLSAGIYVIGEDLEPGSYSLTVVGNCDGTLALFKSYDDYLDKDGNEFSAFYRQDIMDEETKAYYINEGQYIFSLYVSELSNLNLRKGMCLMIKGATMIAHKK